MSAESKETINVAVTGGAGQIGYSLIPKILDGSVFGDKAIDLRLLEAEVGADYPEDQLKPIEKLEGVAMEADDLGSPYLKDISITTDPNKAFDGVNFSFMVGASPRGPGMDRSDLLKANAPIFVGQGQALNESAADDVRVLVVGNPANTNALITLSNAPDIPKERFSAMSRLDHNRALAELASEHGVSTDRIQNLWIGGNHSNTMVPVLEDVKIDGNPLKPWLDENKEWYEGYVEKIAKRGGAIIDARGASSAMSAANAAADHARDLTLGSHGGWRSMGVYSYGEYGSPEGVVYSLPVLTISNGDFVVISDLTTISEDTQSRLDASGKELLDERDVLEQLGVLAVKG